MIRELLRKIFIEDALLKLLSFVLAIVLFLLRSDWDATVSGYVKVYYTQPRDRVVTSELIREVKIVVRGPYGRIHRFNEGDLDPIVVDLTKRPEGELHFTEDMVQLPQGLRVASFTPAWLYINFDPLVERTLPVQPVMEGEPAEGYRVSRISTVPRVVRVSGAKAVVEAMGNVLTRPVRVSDLRSAVELPIKLAPPQKNVRTMDPMDVKVHVEVERTLVEQRYPSVQVTVTGSSHIEDIELSPAAATVLLRGPALALARFKGTPELVVDAATEERKPAGTYRKRLQVVNLPPDIAAEIRPDWVLMTTLKTPKK